MRRSVKGDFLDRVAFPLGGLGAGMFCLEGTGALSHFSLRHRPEMFHEPPIFAAVGLQGNALVLEGPVPRWKLFGRPDAARGLPGATYGFPRFDQAQFSSRFPFAFVGLRARDFPLAAEITGWSPFIPLDSYHASLPVASLEYRLTNTTRATIKAVFSFHAKNFLTTGSGKERVLPAKDGFTLSSEETSFSVTAPGQRPRINLAWFRGGWYDAPTLLWKTIAAGESPSAQAIPPGEPPSPGASLFVPLTLKPGQSRTLSLLFSWYTPRSELRYGHDQAEENYRPWYAGQFPDLATLTAYWQNHARSLRRRSLAFRDTFFASTLPPEILEAVAANLTILKSPTVLRQLDGRLWGWEGCFDEAGSHAGSCTHVWNFSQAIAHLFPDLEHTLRETEFNECLDDLGHQDFRAPLPIRPSGHGYHAAADGQLGGILKAFRDWRISGDTAWLQRLWPKIKLSLDYCIRTWDPREQGVIEEPHHNTFDIEFWGPDPMATSLYLAALSAMPIMAEALGEEAEGYPALLKKGRHYLESRLWNGEYFFQEVKWEGLTAPDPLETAVLDKAWYDAPDTRVKGMEKRTFYSPEARIILRREGPKYQFGAGCLATQLLGCWLAEICGLPPFLDPGKVRSALRAIFRHNFKQDLSRHVNPERSTYAQGKEGGLLLCTWPKGDRPSLPFIYADEAWTGVEYQVAAQLFSAGLAREAMTVVRACRARYDGRYRNPFDEYECGHWYSRALASYDLLRAAGGVRYDALTQALHLFPSRRGDFSCFLSTATGYGLAGLKRGKPFVEVREGKIPIRHVAFNPA